MDPSILSELIEEKQFKPLVAHLKLARDSLAGNPLVSYWAVYYVLEQGIKTPNQDDNYRRCLGKIMTCLEKEKAVHPEFGNEGQAKANIENYANQLLVRAENESELGVSPSVAIKLYMACANVSQLLTLFGDNSEENSKRIKYSKWKAVTIAKEAKAGPPQPPAAPTNNDNAFSGGYEPYPPNNQNNEDSDYSNYYQPPASGPTISAAPEPKEEPELNFANLTLTDSENKKAELLCESALYAIRGGDILSAVTSLKQTLQMLQKAARSN